MMAHSAALLSVITLIASFVSAQTWTQRFPATSPPPRYRAMMTYDTARGQTILFGGLGSSLTALNDTWVWDGVSWTEKFPLANPSARTFSQLVYDAATQKVLMFGGATCDSLSGCSLGDTWVWDGYNWTQLFPQTSPSVRAGAMMAYDPVRQQIILFGGCCVQNGGDFDDTWAWDGTNWHQLSPPASPPADALMPMFYDSTQRGIIYVYANYFDLETWMWTGNTWVNEESVSPLGAEPSTADDPSHNEAIFFGGLDIYQYLNYTWAWNGSSWILLSPPISPPARFGASMIFDVARGEDVLFGGSGQIGGFLNDTWVWSGYPLTNTPLKGISGASDTKLRPYTIPIFTAFDHSMEDTLNLYHIYGFDGIVEAFTNEYGECTYSPPPPQCPASRDGYYNSGHSAFGVTGHYLGASSDGGILKLQYEGHPGYDFDASCQRNAQGQCIVSTGTNVYAVGAGTISYPTTMVGLGSAPSQYHALELVPDDAPYLRVYYLHLSTYPGTQPFNATDPSPAPGCPSSVTLPLAAGHVGAGCLIAQSGNTAPPPGVGPHLHLEVQRVLPYANLPSYNMLSCQLHPAMMCIPVDPYGSSCGTDPYYRQLQIPNMPLWNFPSYLSANSLCFGTEPLGRWDQQKISLTDVAVSALRIQGITVSGSNSADFTQTNTCAASLNPGQSCQFYVTFSPTAMGDRAAFLTITGSDGAGSQGEVRLVVGLSGIGAN